LLTVEEGMVAADMVAAVFTAADMAEDSEVVDTVAAVMEDIGVGIIMVPIMVATVDMVDMVDMETTTDIAHTIHISLENA
jgi:hypothetical protein